MMNLLDVGKSILLVSLAFLVIVAISIATVMFSLWLVVSL